MGKISSELLLYFFAPAENCEEIKAANWVLVPTWINMAIEFRL